MAGDLGAGVYHAQPADLQNFVVQVVMQCLPVLRQNGRERGHIAAADHNALHCAHHLLLYHSGAHKLHCGVVHCIAQVAGAVNLCYLARLLYKSLGHNGFDELFAGAFVYRGGFAVQDFGEQDDVVGAVLRDIMHRASFCQGLGHKAGQTCKGVGLPYSDLGGLVCNALLRTHPYDVVNIHIVAKNNLSAAVNVNHGRQAGLVQPEIIQERAVLPESISVVGIIRRGFVVAQKD